MPGSRPAPILSRRRFVRCSAAAALAAGGVARLAAEDRTTQGAGLSRSVDVPAMGSRLSALAADAPLAMQFRGESADEARRWQAEFAAKLRELLGPHQPPAKYESALERRVETPTHVREERVLTAEGVPPVPYHLLLPHDVPGTSGGTLDGRRRAGILAVHGHGPFGHDAVAGIDGTPERRVDIEKCRYDYGRQLVERGYVVAAPCLTPFGRRLGDGKSKRGDPCTLANLLLQHVGKLLIAENLRDCLWTFQALAAHPAVDAERLGCVGLSYGGRMTTLTAALEPRVRVAVIAGAMNVFQERAMSQATSGCQVIPGLLNYGDMPEVGSLIAPRPCVWSVGAQDRLLDPGWVEKFRVRLDRVYRALGAEEQLVVDRFSGGHEWHGEAAYPILEKVLA